MIVSGTSKDVKDLELDCKPEIDIQECKKIENVYKETNILEAGYYIQSYTCESGELAKFIIPEDDLFAFEDMLKIVLKRKFKLNMEK